MLYSQMTFIWKQANFYLEELEAGNIECQSPDCYDMDGKPIKEAISKYIKGMSNRFSNEYNGPVRAFFIKHEKQSPTQQECEEGIDYLANENVSFLMITWFIKSYGAVDCDVLEKELIYNAKKLTINKRQPIDISHIKTDEMEDQYTT